MSMTVQVAIPDDLIPRLEQKARSAGLDREQYVRALVSRDLTGPRTFDEILGGFREEVAASGISDFGIGSTVRFGPAGLARRTQKYPLEVADARTLTARSVRLHNLPASRCATSESIWCMPCLG